MTNRKKAKVKVWALEIKSTSGEYEIVNIKVPIATDHDQQTLDYYAEDVFPLIEKYQDSDDAFESCSFSGEGQLSDTILKRFDDSPVFGTPIEEKPEAVASPLGDSNGFVELSNQNTQNPIMVLRYRGTVTYTEICINQERVMELKVVWTEDVGSSVTIYDYKTTAPKSYMRGPTPSINESLQRDIPTYLKSHLPEAWVPPQDIEI